MILAPPAAPASTAPITIHAWPGSLQQALADLRGPTGLTVISVATPLTESRVDARGAIRHALRQTLATFLAVPLASVTLLSSPGMPVQMLANSPPVHIAISHMPGLSVAAVSTRRAVGIDVMALGAQSLPDWETVAHDYLGPVATAELKRTPPADRAAAFAQAWTALEARLKCLGLVLTEWTPEIAARLNGCRVVAFTVPAGCCGTLAVAPILP